jgi:hypothetical protein
VDADLLDRALRGLADQVQRRRRVEAEDEHQRDQRTDHPAFAMGRVLGLGQLGPDRPGEGPLVGDQDVQGGQHHPDGGDHSGRSLPTVRTDQHHQLADEGGHAGQGERGETDDEEQSGQHRRDLLQPAEVRDPLRTAVAPRHHAAEQEQTTGRQPVVEHVEGRPLDAHRGEREDAQHDETEVRDRGVRDESHDVLLTDREQRAIHDRDDREDDDHRGRPARRVREQRQAQRQHPEGADLVQDADEER